MVVEPQARVGEIFESKYQIEELLGTGAMGSVFRARHVTIGRPFAVKLLHPRFLKDAKLLRRFEREAELAGKLSHPNVVSVVDVGKHDGVSFLVMDLANGVSLSALLYDGPLPIARALSLVRQICDGLEHAHEHGLIHRDLKPDNIIVDPDGTARIVDFGIALLRDGSGENQERLTTGGIVLGTPQYMAPELAMGSPIDHRIDLFALGVICFQMFTGHMPFSGDGVTVAMANITSPTPKMLGVDPLLEAFTHKLMAKDRDKRPPTAAAARKLLDMIAHDRKTAADELGVVDAPPVPTGELPRSAATGAIGTAATVAMGTAPTVAVTTSQLVKQHRSWRVPIIIIALAAALIVAAVAIAFATRRRSAEAPHLAPSSHAESDDPSERVPASEQAPPPPAAVTTAPVVAARAQATQPPPPAAPAITADSVARHYAVVGRKLKALDQRGVAAKDLWQRYLTIHINDVMSDPAQLGATESLLANLEQLALTRDLPR